MLDIIYERHPTLKQNAEEIKRLIHSINNRKATLFATPVTSLTRESIERDLSEIRSMEARYIGNMQVILLAIGMLDFNDIYGAIASQTVAP